MKRLKMAAATAERVESVIGRLREVDRRELEAGCALTAAETVRWSVECGRRYGEVWAMVDDETGEAMGLFGVSCGGALGVEGHPWLVACEGFADYAGGFARGSRKVVAHWAERYRSLGVLVHSRHEESVKWLRWLGFRPEWDGAHGPKGERFYLMKLKQRQEVSHV